MSATATYTKMGDAWGIKVTGAKPAAGQVVRVRKASGEEKDETVLEVLYTENGAHVCTIRQRGYAGGSSKSTYAPRSRRTRGGDCDDFCQGCRRCM